MNRVLGITGALLVFAAARTAQAQYIQPQVSPYGNPGTTPYINLLQRNMNPALTYQGIVQPQLQTQSNFQYLQSEINTNRTTYPTVAPPRNSGVADTGYAPARFMQYQQYYFSLPTGRGGNYQNGGGTAGGAPPRPAPWPPRSEDAEHATQRIDSPASRAILAAAFAAGMAFCLPCCPQRLIDTDGKWAPHL